MLSKLLITTSYYAWQGRLVSMARPAGPPDDVVLIEPPRARAKSSHRPLASIRGSLRFCIPIGDRDLLVHLTDGQWSIRLSLMSGRHYQAVLLESRESIRADANCVVFRHQCRRRIPAYVVCRNGLGKVVTRNRDRCAGNHGSGRIGDRSGD